MPFSKIVKEVVKKKDGAWKTPPETKRSEKTLGIYKRNKTPNMPTSEELWGDSQSGLAANAPFRSALSLSFYRV